MTVTSDPRALRYCAIYDEIYKLGRLFPPAIQLKEASLSLVPDILHAVPELTGAPADRRLCVEGLVAHRYMGENVFTE